MSEEPTTENQEKNIQAMALAICCLVVKKASSLGEETEDADGDNDIAVSSGLCPIFDKSRVVHTRMIPKLKRSHNTAVINQMLRIFSTLVQSYQYIVGGICRR